MPLDAVIFDVDGTFVDTNETHARAWGKAFEQYGFGLPVSRFRPEIGKGSREMLRDVLGPEAAEKFGEPLCTAHGEHYRAIVDEEGVRVFSEAVALLEAVKTEGLLTALATAADQ